MLVFSENPAHVQNEWSLKLILFSYWLERKRGSKGFLYLYDMPQGQFNYPMIV